MKARDSNGRYIKKGDGESQLTLIFPSIQSIAYWILMFIIFLPWILILSKFSLFEKLNMIFQTLINGKNEEPAENGKKNDLFY